MSDREFNWKKIPFPYFGGKTKAAPIVWAALGDVPHYVEPFCGGMAVLINRPHEPNRPYFSETVNDIDGLLINAWRGIQLYPRETAEAASWPVAEADLMARHLAILKWKSERQLEHLMGDPAFCDPKIAGWWLWGKCSWIGSGWCFGDGPWVVDENGFVVKRPKNGGVWRQLPHVSDNGSGVNNPTLREPGVWRQSPHVSDDGRGVNHANLREPGVHRQLPHVSDGGRGVNHANLREPGVHRQLPDVSNGGRGVNHANLRELGVMGDDNPGGAEYHPIVMPKLHVWFDFLSARLRHVRILNGDWKRAVTGGVTLTIQVRGGHGPCGVFLDPPYADTANRDRGIYSQDSLTVAHDVREWALANGNDKRYRIVVAGFDGEHGTAFTDAGWREVEWFEKGYLGGGMGNIARNGTTSQQHRERLWLSPHCLPIDGPGDDKNDSPGLFDGIEEDEGYDDTD